MLEFLTLHWQMILVAYLVLGVVGHVVLWVVYIAVMGLKRVRDTNSTAFNHPIVKVLGAIILFFGLMLDVFLNVVYHTLICLDIPQEATITSRLKRYNQDPYEWSWRKKVASFFEPLLDPFDPSGDHI